MTISIAISQKLAFRLQMWKDKMLSMIMAKIIQIF